MARSDKTLLRLKCPRCCNRLKASPGQIGTKRRCPKCQHVFVVPSAEELARRQVKVEQYRYREAAGAASEVDQPHIPIKCPLCGTHLQARQDQIGQQIVCPDCHTAVLVEASAQKQIRARPSKKTPSPVADEAGYVTADEADRLAQGPRPAEQTYFPTHCPLCGTHMQARADQVGREMVCPDCQRPMIVPPPPKKRANRGPTEVDEQAAYVVRKETGQAREDYAAYFPVKCPLCSTRLHATKDQIGCEMLCPDCNESFVVGPPPKPKRKYDPRDEFDGIFGVSEASEPEQHSSLPQPRWKGRLETEAAEEAEARRNEEARRRQAGPPRRPLVTGVFNIAWYPGVRVRWLWLSAVGTLVLAAVVMAISMVAGPGGGYGSVGPWIMGMLLSGTAFLFGMGWVGVTSINCLTILSDTAEGKDEVDAWPEGAFLDWVGDFFFVFNSLGIAMLPGIAVGKLLVGFVGHGAWLAVPLGTVVMFPVFLLSMLEANSPMMPLSLPVWRSLLRVWWAWGLFYLETTLLGAVLIGVAIGAASLKLTLWLAVPMASLLLVAAAMIYFRLLGRVAWCYTEAVAKDEREVAESANGEEREA